MLKNNWKRKWIIKNGCLFYCSKNSFGCNGLKYICEKQERLSVINIVLGFKIKNRPSSRLINYIIRCYCILSENPEGKYLLKNNLP